MHYFNQAAGGLMPDRALHAITAHLQREQHAGPYAAAQQAQPQLQALYANEQLQTTPSSPVPPQPTHIPRC